MTLGGWLMMLGTWGVVIAVTVFCLARLFGKRSGE